MIRLLDFQREDYYLTEDFDGRVLLSWQMGLGKTIFSLAWIKRHPESRPILVVCPKGLKLYWERQAFNLIGMKSDILQGRKPPTRPTLFQPPMLIINYEILEKWLPYLEELDIQLLILDEGQYIKDMNSKRTKAIIQLSKGIPEIIICTGTPMENSAIELWPFIKILRPRLFRSFKEFADRYTRPKMRPWGWEYKGARNLDELHDILEANLMIRRRKIDVIDQLPPKIRTVVPLEIMDRKQYDHALTDFLGWIKVEYRSKYRRAKRAEALTKLTYLLGLAGELKARYVLEWIDEWLEETTGKIVLFSVHTKMVNSIKLHYRENSVCIDGSTSQRDREIAEKMFLHDPSIRIMNAQIRAGGVGLDFTAAHTVAFPEIHWNPAVILQAEDRVYARLNDLHGAEIFFLVAKNTIEERLCEAIQEKQRNSEAAIDGVVESNKGELDIHNMLIDEMLRLEERSTEYV